MTQEPGESFIIDRKGDPRVDTASDFIAGR